MSEFSIVRDSEGLLDVQLGAGSVLVSCTRRRVGLALLKLFNFLLGHLLLFLLLSWSLFPLPGIFLDCKSADLIGHIFRFTVQNVINRVVDPTEQGMFMCQ